MSIKIQNLLFTLLLSSLYLLAIFSCLSDEKYWVLAIPIVASVVVLPIFNFKYIFYAVVFLTPLSMSLSDLGVFILDTEMAFPTEPILFGCVILVLFQIAYNFKLFKPVFRHPITLCILLYLLWMLVTCITSSMPFVSLKVWLSRIWYITPIFFMGSVLFQDRKNISFFILLYAIPLSIVVLYTMIRHSGYFFDKDSAHYMMSPFFNDHTSYGAMIAFYIPLVIALFWIKRDNFLLKTLVLGIVLIFILGLILSFTRAAWISLFISCIIAIIIQLKVNRLVLFTSPFILVLFMFLFQNSIVSILESNRQDSSDNLMEHVSSISNISTDASNMERINRWKCALKMFAEKPVFGWGPGTYQFQYARFQLSSDRTIISSNSGDMGNAHSEYLGPLCESGFLGFFTFFILVIVTIIRAINMYYKSNDKIVNAWLLAIIIALTSYFIHGLFNNFLDTDKASIAVWGVIAILVALDVKNHKKTI